MTTKISQDVMRLLFGDGLIAHENLGWDIEKVTGPNPDFITRCVLDGRTWGKLESDEKGVYAGAQQFNLARSAKIKELRRKLAPIKSRLIDIRSLEIPQRSFTPDEVAALLHISPGRLNEMMKSPKGDKALVDHIRAYHMPRRPMLVDVLVNAPVTVQEGLDLIESHWRGWSPERQNFMKIWSLPEMVSANFVQTRQTWSIHKLAVLEDLNIPNSLKRVQRMLRWPDVWAWRGLLCGQRLDEAYRSRTSLLEEIGIAQVEFDSMAELAEDALDKLG